jgi:hypothetical protein
MRWRHLSLEQRCNSESLYGLLLIPSTYLLLIQQRCADVGLCLKTIGAMSFTYANEPLKLRFVVGTIKHDFRTLRRFLAAVTGRRFSLEKSEAGGFVICWIVSSPETRA